MWAAPEEVSGVVRFLCSEEASYITGQVIGVNGGMCWTWQVSAKTRRRARRPFMMRCVGHTALVTFVLITSGWSSSWDSIRAAARDIQSIQAAFTQEKHLQILARPLKSHGRLIFAAPDRLRWEYLAPPAQRSPDGRGPHPTLRQNRR